MKLAFSILGAMASEWPLFPQAAREKLAVYAEMLLKWNKSLNLVGASDPRGIYDLLADSFYLADFLDRLRLKTEPLIWDPGAGAGLPGIPLRIVWQRGEYAMIEPRQKRALFVANVLASLRLPRTTIYRGSFEEYTRLKGKSVPGADCIVSRAFKPWPELLPLCAAALRPDGIAIIMANTPPSALPSGWIHLDSTCYFREDKTRWLWALVAARETSAQ